jgi:hypothetical protein
VRLWFDDPGSKRVPWSLLYPRSQGFSLLAFEVRICPPVFPVRVGQRGSLTPAFGHLDSFRSIQPLPGSTIAYRECVKRVISDRSSSLHCTSRISLPESGGPRDAGEGMRLGSLKTKYSLEYGELRAELRARGVVVEAYPGLMPRISIGVHRTFSNGVRSSFSPLPPGPFPCSWQTLGGSC